MAYLRVAVLGGFSAVYTLGRVVDIAASCKPILGYLIVNRYRTLNRTEVAEALWQDRETKRARRCLSTALWRLKQSEPGTDFIDHKGNSENISFNWRLPGRVDVVAFENRAAAALAVHPEDAGPRELRHMQRAVSLYRGDLLAGIDEDWVLIERQRLRNVFLDLLQHLAATYDATSNIQNALVYARRLSALDPLREDVHRLIMKLFVKVGNRAKAIEQYRICQGELSLELGVEPTEETQALYRSIVGQPAPQTASPQITQEVSVDIASENLMWVRRALAASDKRLSESLKLLNRAQRAAGQQNVRG